MKDYSYEEISRFMVEVREVTGKKDKNSYEFAMLKYYAGQMSMIKILLHHMIELRGTADSLTATLEALADITEKNIKDLL